MNNRLDYIDKLRGFAILCVLVGHILIIYTQEKTRYPLVEIIYSFHMPLFFFVSGYVGYKSQSTQKGVYSFLKGKVKSLLIPYITWLFVMPLMLNNEYPSNLSAIIQKFNFVPNLNYWFLPLMFTFYVIYLFWHKYSFFLGGKKELEGLLVLFSTIVLTGLLFKSYYTCVYAIYGLSFFFGYFISKYTIIEKFCCQRRVAIFSIFLLILLWKIFPLDTSINPSPTYSLLNLGSFLVTSLLSIILFLCFFKTVTMPSFVSSVLIELGKSTMALYLLPIYLLPSGYVFPSNLPYSLVTILAIIISLVQGFVSYLIFKACLQIPIIPNILFGSKSKTTL